MIRSVFALLLFTACTSSSTGSTCPASKPPTYTGFAKPFFATYCTGCHARGATNRHGAPVDQNFDSEADIKAHAVEIDGEAAKGPDATNVDMPDMSGPVRTPPSDAERAELGQFLACERRSP